MMLKSNATDRGEIAAAHHGRKAVIGGFATAFRHAKVKRMNEQRPPCGGL